MDNTARKALNAYGFAQVVVVWKQEPGTESTAAVEDSRSRAAYFLSQRPEAVIGAAAAMEAAAPASRYFPRIGISIGYVDREGAKALTANQRVRNVYHADQLSLIRPVGAAVPNATVAEANAGITWGLQRLGVQALWNQNIRGMGVRVGHLDTGVDGAHPALQGRIAQFAEFDNDGNQVSGSVPHDTGQHGTHTAGTICGSQINGISIGVAPEALLCSAIVIEGGQVLLRILAGMEWVLNQNVQVLSMSLGIRGFTPFLEDVTRRIVQNNVLPVFAIGNEGAGTSRSPGNYPEVLSVGAIDESDQVASFSSSITFDRPVEPSVPILVAPGVNVVSALPGGGMQALSGTSMATPHIAGIAALLFQAKPQATVTQVQQALVSTCIPLPNVPSLREGHGLVNPLAALNALG
jgi:subtilisin